MKLKVHNVPVRSFTEATIDIPDPPKALRSKNGELTDEQRAALMEQKR